MAMAVAMAMENATENANTNATTKTMTKMQIHPPVIRDWANYYYCYQCPSEVVYPFLSGGFQTKGFDQGAGILCEQTSCACVFDASTPHMSHKVISQIE